MSSPLLPLAQTTSEIFSHNYYKDDPENVDDLELELSIKSNSVGNQNLDHAGVEEHDSDEDEIEAVWRTNLMIEGEEERRQLRIESMMVKKTSLEMNFEAAQVFNHNSGFWSAQNRTQPNQKHTKNCVFLF